MVGKETASAEIRYNPGKNICQCEEYAGIKAGRCPYRGRIALEFRIDAKCAVAGLSHRRHSQTGKRATESRRPFPAHAEWKTRPFETLTDHPASAVPRIRAHVHGPCDQPAL